MLKVGQKDTATHPVNEYCYSKFTRTQKYSRQGEPII